MYMNMMLNLSFGIFKCLGLWQPVTWCPGWKSKLYSMYSIFIVLLIHSSTISEFLGLLESNGIHEIINNSVLLLSMIGACGKAMIIIGQYHRIVQLVETLQCFPCQPQNADENLIKIKFDRIIK